MKLRTAVRCVLVIFIVVLPPTAGCRHPFNKVFIRQRQYALAHWAPVKTDYVKVQNRVRDRLEEQTAA